MTNPCIIGLGVMIILVVGLICTSVLIWLSIKYSKSNNEAIYKLSQYQVNVQAVIDETIPAILNSVIEECFDDYKLLVLFPKNEGYINDTREKEIRSDLVRKVTERLSPMALDKLSLYYNIKNIDIILADKIYITVLNYVIEHNSIKDNLSEIPKI